MKPVSKTRLLSLLAPSLMVIGWASPLHAKLTEKGQGAGVCETMNTYYKGLEAEDDRLYEQLDKGIKERNAQADKFSGKASEKQSIRKMDEVLDSKEHARRELASTMDQTFRNMIEAGCEGVTSKSMPHEPFPADSCTGSWRSPRERGIRKLPCYQ